MKCIKGNKVVELNATELDELANQYEEVVVDLGTGDGRFVYKNAKTEHNKLFIGIDTLAATLEEYSKKARKEKIYNAVFVIGSLELLPQELIGKVDRLFILLPWGTLLQNIVNTNPQGIKQISSLLKEEAKLQIILGYDSRFEPKEAQRLELPSEINLALINETIIPKFLDYGNFVLEDCSEIAKTDLEKFETTWSKRLAFGKERPVFNLVFKKHS